MGALANLLNGADYPLSDVLAVAEVVLADESATELLALEPAESCSFRSSNREVVRIFKSGLRCCVLKAEEVKEVDDDSPVAVDVGPVCAIEADALAIGAHDGSKECCHDDMC